MILIVPMLIAVLVLTGGRYVRVSGMPAAVREVAVRTGRVWTVGPDAEGRLAVRVDGLHAAWPARLVPPRTGTAALPTGEPVATMWVGPPLPRVSSALGIFLAGNSVIVPLYLSEWALWQEVMLPVAYLFVMSAFLMRSRYFARLRPSEPWIRAEVVGFPQYPIVATARLAPVRT